MPDKLGPENASLMGGIESQAYPVCLNIDYGKRDTVADNDLLARIPAQDQHVNPP
jgi:hypothetical protein